MTMTMTDPTGSLPPGFRFHPTDEELILHYLRNRATSKPCPVSIIAEIDIYKFDPWNLPAMAMFGDREWYFFTPRDRKYPNGVRPNRAAASGYWKATGTDKPIHASSGNENIGVKKALVFYKGRPPKGIKTNWIMHEYRLAETHATNTYKPVKLRDTSMRLDDWVLCRIYKKSNGLSSVEPAPMDRETEDSGMDDGYLSSLQTIAPPPPPPPPPVQENTLKLQKTLSVSDFFDDCSVLSHLFDNLPELPGAEIGSVMGNSNARQPFNNSSGNNNGVNYLVHQLSHTGSPAFIAENYPKRQRTADEEMAGVLHPAKKRNSSCNLANFTTQFDGPQYNMMNQPLFNQQLLLNAHLGLH